MKTVSIIIPVYNDEKYIEKTLGSVCGQTYTELEIIVVNDGSTDASPAMIDAAAANDPRIRVIHKQNEGVSVARNTGLAAATGDFICWLDGDDWMEPEMIATLMDAAEKNGADAVLANYYNVSPRSGNVPRYKEGCGRAYTSEEAVHALITKELSQSLCMNIVRRELYEGIVFPAGKLFEDVRNTYRIYGRCKKLVLVEDILVNRLIRYNSISNEYKIGKRVESTEAYLERQAEINKLHPEWEKDFVANNCETLLLLRSAVVHAPAKKCREYKDRIRPVVRYFRDRMHMYPGKKAKLGARLEYFLLTSGTYAGMMLSILVGRFAKKRSFLK